MENGGTVVPPWNFQKTLLKTSAILNDYGGFTNYW